MDIRKQILFTGALLAISSMAIAEEHSEEEDYDPFFELIVMGGIASLDAEDSTIVVTNSETDKLVQTNDDEWEASTGRLGVGYNIPLADEIEEDELVWFPIITPQLNYYYLNGDINGDVLRFEDPNDISENYIMDFTSNRVMLDIALTVAAYEHFSVYALAGAGISWNDIDFSSGLLPGQGGCPDCTLEPLALDSETSSGFAYEFGVGVNYAALEYLTVSLEYLYTGFTDVQTGNSDEDSSDVFGGTDMDINTQALLLGIRVGL